MTLTTKHEPYLIPKIKDSIYKEEIKNIIFENFSNHPGELDGVNIPCNRKEAKKWLKSFLEERFTLFGDYEDAVDQNNNILFHSALSPYLNLGIITPEIILDRILTSHKKKKIRINSLEGYIRQLIGWREFMRGIYQNFDNKLETGNFFKHNRKMKPSWYEGNTGLPPLDLSLIHI